MKEKKPEIIVFASPNGSGKSTFTALLKPPYDYINADEIKATIQCSDLEASQRADMIKREHLDKRLNFAFETVLSTQRNLELLKDAKNAGYFIKCYYVLTADPAINLARVRFRVMSGGHDVPEDKILSRYYRALSLIPDLLDICDICHIYDNSISPYRIFKKRKDEFFYDVCEDLWDHSQIMELIRIKAAQYRNLNQ